MMFKGILRLRIIFLVVLILKYQVLYSWTLSGIVYDSRTQFPINNARVLIDNLDSGNLDSAFTDASGFWEYNLNPQSIVGEVQFPLTFSLRQNYPNPFNPSTIIEFEVSESGVVILKVHDLLGREVGRFQSRLQPGRYGIEWEAKGSSGVYFYTLIQNGKQVTRKMIQLEGGSGGGFHNLRFLENPETFGKLSPLQLRLVISSYTYLSDTINTTIQGDEYFETGLESVHYHAILADLHNDILEKMVHDSSYHLSDWHSYNHTDIPRLEAGGVDVQLFAVWVSPYDYPEHPFQQGLNMINRFQQELDLNSDKLHQVFYYDDLLATVQAGKIGGILAVEGGHAIENDLEKLIQFYNLGVRYMTITWNNSTDWAISAKDPLSETVGLSDFGREVIRTMDSLGMIIDVSHTGIKTIEDILEVTENPIIASHSGARALRDHYRNLYDYQIQEIASTGGVIGVVFYPPFLSDNSSSVTVNTVLDHIDYIANLVGVDYVALGSDFDGIGQVPIGLENVSKFPMITMGLFQRGYSVAEIEKILGGNFLRVFQEVCGGNRRRLSEKAVYDVF